MNKENLPLLSWDDIIDMVVRIDEKGDILAANKSFHDMFGTSDNDAFASSFYSLVYPEDILLVKVHMMAKLTSLHEARGMEFRTVDQHKNIVVVECNAKQVPGDSGPAGLQMVLRDVASRKVHERDHAKATTILGLAKLAEFRDEDTGGHLERIREYSKVLARELSIAPKYKGYIQREYIEDLFQSSILHDIGKVGIPDNILLKPGKLTSEEFSEMKNHAQLGGDVLHAIDNRIDGQSFLTLGKQIAYYHHEKWDGSGYWQGLKGENIPLSARIVALADVYDALTSKRAYKEPFTHRKAGDIITNEKGTHFDPDVVDAFVSCEDKFSEIAARKK